MVKDKEDKAKSSLKRIVSKAILKKSKQVTVKVEPHEYNLTKKMDRDKSRFFKQTWEEERKRLFFK